MKRVILSLVLVSGTALGCASAFAAIKPCEDLKAEIGDKLKAKGVANYTLEIVAADDVKDQKVVGSCDGGNKRITYARGKAAQAEAAAAAPAKTAQAEANAAAPAAHAADGAAAAKTAPAANSPAAPAKAAPAAASAAPSK